MPRRNSLRCLLFSHAPNRRKVGRSEDDTYIGHCIRCGVPLKMLDADKWVRD